MVSRRREKIRELIRADEEAFRERRVAEWRRQIPSAFRGFSIPDLLDTQCEGRISKSDTRQVKSFLKDPSKYMILTGMAGLGKSTLAVTIATHLIDTGIVNKGIYISTPNLLNKFSFGMKDGDPLREHSEVDLLILDDVGAARETVTEHQKSAMWSMIDSRWSNSDLVTIMTTNMSISSSEAGIGLIDWFGPSAWDRIGDDMIHVHFKGSSFRGDDLDD